MSSITNIMLEAYLQLGTENQRVTAENVANANTPGYQTKTINMPNSFAELVKVANSNPQIQVAVTDSNHLQGTRAGSKFRTTLDKTATELKPNGNNVSLTAQAQKATQNKINFEQALKAYESSSKLIMLALGKGK